MSFKTQGRCPTGSNGAGECGISAPGWRLPWCLCGYVGGTVLQLQQRALWPWPFYALALLLALGLLWRVRRHPVGLCLAAAVLALALCGLRASVFLAQALDPLWEGRDVRVTGMVSAMPQWQDNGLRLRLAVEAVEAVKVAQRANDSVQPARLPPVIDVAWYASDFSGTRRAPLPLVHAGERWQFTVRLKAPHGARNPHGFDYELWLWEQGVQATGYVRDGPRDSPPVRLAATWQHPIERAREQVRDSIVQRFVSADTAHRQAAGVVAALVTGDQRAIARADWQVFRATGVAHLVSISGLHISMFAWLATILVGCVWRCSVRLCLAIPVPTAALVGAIVLATAYAVFSGWGVPAQRTVCMLITVGLLRLSGKRWPWPHVWLLAATVVLVIDPWALLQAGFWLSFVAVAVLFAAAAPHFYAPAQPYGWQRLKQALLAPLRAQWVITLTLTPLTLLLFGQVSLVGFVANAFAIPWTTLVIAPLALLGLLFPAIWQVAVWCVQWQSAGLHWLAVWPWAQVIVPMAPLWAGMAAMAGGLLLALHLPWRVRLLGLPLVLPVLCWPPPRPAMGQFDVLAADVGQGQAVLVRTLRHSLLYDTGPRYSATSDAGERVVVPLLQALGERLDRVILSHGDSDHIGGVDAVQAQQPQAALQGSIETGHPLHKRHAIGPCAQGQQWEWDGVQFEVLHPPPWYAAPNRNAQSCVVRVTSQSGTAALLTGDIERPQELVLVRAAQEGDMVLTADLLLVPHHGSKTSSSPPFLAAVRPSVAVVQAGYRNRFGHPAAPVWQRYTQQGIRVVQTPACGAATWQSSRPESVHCHRETQRRYWHHRFTLAPSTP